MAGGFANFSWRSLCQNLAALGVEDVQIGSLFGSRMSRRGAMEPAALQKLTLG